MDNFYRDLKGLPSQGVKDVSAEAKYPVGTRYAENDGRVYRYGLFGGAVNPADLLQTPPLQGAVGTLQAGLTVVSDVAAGAYSISVNVDTTAQPKDRFKGGWIGVTPAADGNIGDVYLISGHEASVGGVLELKLAYPVKRAIPAGASKASLMASPYNNVIQAPITTATGGIAGVAPTVGAQGNFGWIQTWGPCLVKAGVEVKPGNSVIRDLSTAGCVCPADGTKITEVLGVGGWEIAAGDAGYINLMIAA